MKLNICFIRIPQHHVIFQHENYHLVCHIPSRCSESYNIRISGTGFSRINAETCVYPAFINAVTCYANFLLCEIWFRPDWLSLE
uniref:Uncharacterized protein n=1 Tax=Physcomitrium patens TaxID=3218 RepID=A0A2K1IV78_PHYPA|nr:hypothetical protein PHYPA_025127 [Physcomitrium patens]